VLLDISVTGHLGLTSLSPLKSQSSQSGSFGFLLAG
jgi:hypothetical protein